MGRWTLEARLKLSETVWAKRVRRHKRNSGASTKAYHRAKQLLKTLNREP